MKTHKFDAVSFLSGLMFTAFGLLFLIPRQTDDLIDFVAGFGTWVWPVILLGVGIAILVPVFSGFNQESIEGSPELDSVETG